MLALQRAQQRRERAGQREKKGHLCATLPPSLPYVAAIENLKASYRRRLGIPYPLRCPPFKASRSRMGDRKKHRMESGVFLHLRARGQFHAGPPRWNCHRTLESQFSLKIAP